MIHAENGSNVKVYGFVFEFGTNKPLQGARINVAASQTSAQTLLAETNASGYFEGHVKSFSEYTFIAYCDDPATSGLDYVPAYKGVFIGSTPQHLSFFLLPGASINATEDPFFLLDEVLFSYEVKDEKGLLESSGSISQSSEWRALAIKQRIIPVPANLGVKIEINIYRRPFGMFMRPRREGAVTIVIPANGSYMYFKQGECVTLNLRICRLNLEVYKGVPQLLERTKSLSDRIGVLSSYEKIKILEGERLLRRAQMRMSEGDYVSAQVDLSEAYLTLKNIEESLMDMFRNSTSSIYFITPFVGFTSSALGTMLFRSKRRRIIASAAIYAFLIFLVYLVYPGYTLLRDPEYNPLAGSPLEQFTVPLILASSFLIGAVLINAPYTYGEKTDRRTLSVRSAILASFSLAAENLKRRKIRNLLVMIMTAISISAFMILTSYSYEGGLIVKKMQKTAPSNGIFIFQQSTERNIYPFGPVDQQVIQWLSQRTDVQQIAPLLKNNPQIGTPPPFLGYLINPSLKLDFGVSGVLGVKPSLEIGMIGLDEIIVEGRFLNDSDLSGILISREAKEALQVNLNSIVDFCDKEFIIVGFFDSLKLGEIKDLNGEPILPQEIRVLETQGGPVYISNYVSPGRVVIMLDEAAYDLPLNIVVSRINVKAVSDEDAFSLARALVLLFPRIETFISTDDEIMHLFVGYDVVSYGFTESLLLLVLVSLNVGVMMLNCVYERRREIATLSTVGLNPSQISAIFTCEALIMAFIAGSLGYVSGLMSYFLFNLLPSAPIIKYKAEFFWGVFALSLSILASIVGSLVPALKASVIATPSLLRRFIVSSKGERGAWIVDIPLKIEKEKLPGFFKFIEERMKIFNDPTRSEERVDNIRVEKDREDPYILSLYFTYKYAVNKVITENKLFSTIDPSLNNYALKLSSKSLLPWTAAGKKSSAWQTASFIRRLTLEYTEREKIQLQT